jgi:glycosyltransferase involved in cell wall biosynthesis
MKVGWLHSDPGYVGGAELTMAEFRAAAPVDVVDGTDAELVVVGNCFGDPPELDGQRVVQYHHDLRRHPVDADAHIFCSPMQRERYGVDGEVVPPAINASLFKPNRQVRRNGHREGICSVASWQNPGKGAQLLVEYAKENGPVDVWGFGDYVPHGKNLEVKGPVEPEHLPTVLWGYERFVYLPFAPEPFGRAVVEAWYAGLEVITNRLTGALWWLRERPEALESAAEDFWKAVLS